MNIIVDMLRHGEVAGGACYRGRTDDPLSRQGWRQMQQQTRPPYRWQRIVSSPLQRCAAFAEQLSRHAHLPLYLDSQWQEIDFGAWEGLSAEQIESRWPGLLHRFYQNPVDISPPDGETYDAFRQRIQNAWTALLDVSSSDTVLLISHAGVIRMLFSLLLDIPPQHSFRVAIGHASLSRFICYKDGAVIFPQLAFHKPL